MHKLIIIGLLAASTTLLCANITALSTNKTTLHATKKQSKKPASVQQHTYTIPLEVHSALHDVLKAAAKVVKL